jgi:glycosyltransferase involved in cell wall biosynthesis
MTTLVSIITPTYQRRAFFPALVYMYVYQQYPLDKIEFIMYDDSKNNSEVYLRGLFDKYCRAMGKDPSLINFRYEHSTERVPLGKKRNWLNDNSRGEIIICFDDDDYYPPNKVKRTVCRMNASSPPALISGSSEMLIYFSDDETIRKVGPYGTTHCTNGTMAYRREYLLTHRYGDDKEQSEEKDFMNGYDTPVLQLDPRVTILCIAHGRNTVNKRLCKSEPTKLSLRGIIKDKFLYDFFRKKRFEN